jgi:aspartyl protease family protein
MSRRAALFVTVALLLIPALALAQTAIEANDTGKAAYERGDYATAERWFTAAATAMPNEPLYHYHRGAALVRLGRFSEARAAYERAKALRPPAGLSEAIEQALRDLGRTSMRAAAASEAHEARLENRNGIWIAEVTLNGTRRARFLVDTGATYCAISPELADELGVAVPRKSRPVKLQTANGVIEGHLAALESIRVGGAESGDVPIVVHGMPGSPFDGILGNSFLARYAATLDAERHVLNLKPRP